MLAPSAGASPHDCGASSDFLADEGRKAPWDSALLGLGAGCTCCCQDAAVRQRFSEDLQREHACQLGSSEVREGGLGEGGVLLLLLFHTEHLWVFLVPHTGNCLSGRFNHACWFWGFTSPTSTTTVVSLGAFRLRGCEMTEQFKLISSQMEKV